MAEFSPNVLSRKQDRIRILMMSKDTFTEMLFSQIQQSFWHLKRLSQLCPTRGPVEGFVRPV